MNKSISFFCAFVFFSLCTSKAGLNISLTLLSLTAIFIAVKRYNEAFTEIIQQKPIAFSLITFFIGIFSSYISNFDIQELTAYISKGTLFLSLPVLIFMLNKYKTQKIALYSYLTGLIFALIYAIYNWYKLSNFHVTNLTTIRIDSFWDVGRWAEILVYSLCILIPYIIESKERIVIKAALMLISVVSTLCIILSGGRAAIIAIGITAGLYFSLRRPLFMIGTIALLTLTITLFPSSPFINALIERTTSITNTHDNFSNIARLTMWKNGLEMLQEKLAENPGKLLVGSGLKSFKTDLENHLKNKGELLTVAQSTQNQFSMSDSHNTYLDLANKMGILYLIFYIVTLGSFVLFFIQHLKSCQIWAYAGIGLIFCHLIFGFFYTSGLQFQTIILFYLLGLCISHLNITTKESPTYA